MSKVYKSKAGAIEKISARALAYKWIKRMGFLYGKYHIVIASKDCGDINLLLTIDPKMKIIACDTDPKAMKAAAKIPGVILSPFSDIVETTRWAIGKGYDIGSINVDLCCSILYGLPVLKPILDMATCPVIYTYAKREGKDGPRLLGYTKPCIPDKVQSCRSKYIRKHTKKKPVITEPYESDTNDRRVGSHMLMCIFAAPPKRSIATIRKMSKPLCDKTMARLRQILIERKANGHYEY